MRGNGFWLALCAAFILGCDGSVSNGADTDGAGAGVSDATVASRTVASSDAGGDLGVAASTDGTMDTRSSGEGDLPGDAGLCEPAITTFFGLDGSSWTSTPYEHRTVAGQCPEPRPAENGVGYIGNSCVDGGAGGDCVTDLDCNAGLNGRCSCVPTGAVVQSYVGLGYRRCTYDGCISDDDCEGGVCHCDSTYGNTCVGGNCHTDSECGDGGYCSPGHVDWCYGVLGYFCLRPQDDCACQKCPNALAGSCAYAVDAGSWACSACPQDG